jgi:hypothetical protein
MNSLALTDGKLTEPLNVVIGEYNGDVSRKAAVQINK